MNRCRLTCALAFIAAVTLVFPAALGAQGLGQVVLSIFPADTHQLTYTNLRELRDSPNYPAIRTQLMTGELRSLAEVLRSAGDDPEKDADEVVLGWRGTATAPQGFFGLAGGRFHPDQVRDLFKRDQGAATDYSGLHLYAFGSSAGRPNYYFAFLDDSSAAFGHLDDLKALLDARAGARPTLDTNGAFAGWEEELDDSGPVWGISLGRAAASQAALWLTGGVNPPVDLGSLMGPVQAVLYHIDLGNDLAAHIAVICDRPETASALAQVLVMWRNAHPAASSSPPELAAFLAGLDISADGPRVNLDGSGPLSLIQQLGH